MSAFIVHPEHINVLIWAGLRHLRGGAPLGWVFGNPTDVAELTPENATSVGRMLLEENTAGVPTRMGGPGASDDFDEGHRTQEWLATADETAINPRSGGYWYHTANTTAESRHARCTVPGRMFPPA